MDGPSECRRRFQISGEPQLEARLVEVLPFTSALLPRVRRSEALSDIAALHNQHITCRALLETQAYDHPAAASYVVSEIAYLRTTDDANWDQEWLNRLHLLNIVLRDAAQYSLNTSPDVIGGSLDEIFRDLVKREEGRLVKLFSAYAAQDAPASFRLAESCGLDLVEEVPQLIIENCQEPPFLALVVSHSIRDSKHRDRWCAILSEAGLRFKVVAVSLQALPPAAEWDQRIASAPRRTRWSSIAPSGRSMYTDCLTWRCRPRVGGRGVQASVVAPIDPEPQVFA
jgi:hypothetical protein